MGSLASVLPFLAALKKQSPDFSEMTADPSADPVDMSAAANAPQSIPTNPQQLPSPMGPPEDPQQQGPQPDMSIGAGQQPPADLSAAATGKAAQPKLSKGTQLLMLLKGGLQGGLAGYAQNAQTYAQTGRNAGFGGGFYGAQQLPFLQAYQRGELGQQQAQTELLRQQANEINVPGYGTMPAGLAKVLFPSLIRAGATEQAATTRAGATTGAATIGANARIQAARMGLGPDADVPQDLQDQFGLPAKLPLRMLNQAESAANKPLTVVAGANDSYTVNRQTNQKTPLGVGNRGVAVALARPLQVADPNNPGQVSYMPAGQAMQTGAMSPQSATTQAAKAVTKSAVAGPIGNEINANNTAIQHADLLMKAADALHNGDQQTINSLKNRFTNEFGSTGPITANTIAQAYTREITKMLSSGHMTDSEIGQVGSTLDPNRQSLPQMQAVIGAYKALAASKLQQRQNQVTQGMQGRPNFPQAPPPSGASHAVIVNGKVVGYTSDGKTMTPAPQ